jgi:hypothetical protein
MAEELCRNNRGKHGCQNLVTDGGEDNSGYCDTCFYPGIVEANEKYEALLEQGYTRSRAAELAGLNDREPEQKYGTVPITHIDPNPDEEDDEIVAGEDEAEVTDQILTRIEDENDHPDYPG